MAKLWSSTDGVDLANLNATFAPEAVVDPAVGGSGSGDTFPTLTLALSSGARDILVKPGTYNEGVTVSQSNVRIVGAVPPSATAGGARFSQQMNFSGSDVHVENVAVSSPGASSYGFRHQLGANNVTLKRCIAYNAGWNGFVLCWTGAGAGDVVGLRLEDCVAYQCGSSSLGHSGFFVGEGDINFDVVLDRCYAYAAAGAAADGFSVCPAGTAPTGTKSFRRVSLNECFSRSNGRHGLYVGAHVTALVTGGAYIDNGTATTGHGIYCVAPAAFAHARSRIAGVHATGNTGFGLQTSGSTAKIPIVGCTLLGNTGGNLSTNVSGTPGVATANTNSVTI